MRGTNVIRAVSVGGLVLSAALVLGSRDGAAKEIGLQNVTQNWDKNLPSASRFTVLADFNNAAVRDNNTGLVWEQAPNTSTEVWSTAAQICLNKAVGGTTGWRLPSVVELNSVRDPSLPAPFVPTNVFTDIASDLLSNYWTATTKTSDLAVGGPVWVVAFNNGNVIESSRSSPGRVWCVRGDMNADQY